ncbi:MAG: DUF4089 domain-containing protein [Candidatus Rokuibacteriota bacterium]
MSKPARPDVATVEHLARLVGLPLDPAYAAGVAEHFARVMAAAALVMDFPLAEEIEAAPVFRP